MGAWALRPPKGAATQGRQARTKNPCKAPAPQGACAIEYHVVGSSARSAALTLPLSSRERTWLIAAAKPPSAGAPASSRGRFPGRDGAEDAISEAP